MTPKERVDDINRTIEEMIRGHMNTRNLLMQQHIEEAILAEREECAKILDRRYEDLEERWKAYIGTELQDAASEIRARGKSPS